MKAKPAIAVLIGDAAGIGPEIIVKMLAEKRLLEHCSCTLIGDHRILDRTAAGMGAEIHYERIDSKGEIADNGCVQLLQQTHPELERVVPGKISAFCGKAVIEMIQTAAHLAMNKKIDGICYAPLCKASMLEARSPAASETELFAQLLGATGSYGEINMLDGVWTTRVTSHIPLKQVSSALTAEKVLDSIVLANNTLRRAGYPEPRIGVAALNPHAGENGRCGDEEIEIIQPAMDRAVRLGIAVKGLYPSDILFMKAFQGELDAGVTMYHDQGQIAMKLKGFERGVTIAGGLETPITTCAHGTGFDIAGRYVATISSFENALRTVCTMAEG